MRMPISRVLRIGLVVAAGLFIGVVATAGSLLNASAPVTAITTRYKPPSSRSSTGTSGSSNPANIPVPSASALAQSQADLVSDGGPTVAAVQSVAPASLLVWDADGLYLTTDGGTQWQTITPPGILNPLRDVLAVRFVTPNDGWVVLGSSGINGLTIERTVDGGATWTHQSLPNTLYARGLSASLAFTSTHNGYLLLHLPNQPSSLYATTNSGSTWSLITKAAPIRRIRFTNALDGFGLGLNSQHLWKTTDGGNIWSAEPLTGTNTATLTLPQFVGLTGAYVSVPTAPSSLHPATLNVTENGGATWTAKPLPFTVKAPGATSPIAFSMATAHSWFYAGSYTLEVTTDYGIQWTSITPNIPFASIALLDFRTSQDGWAVVNGQWCPGGTATVTACASPLASGSLLLHTTNDGLTFSPVKPPGTSMP